MSVQNISIPITGFAAQDDPDTPIDKMTPLAENTDYYFWMEIGKPVKGSIETTPTDIPVVPEHAQLVVVVFGFRNGIATREGSNVGKLEVLPTGRVKVACQPIARKKEQPDSGYLDDRLFFPVHTPKMTGRYELRCNIYYKQILLQSRLIHVVVAARPTGDLALQSDLDYTLMQTFDAGDLTKFEGHKLSIFLNQNKDATHTFYFLGEDNGTLLDPVSVIVDDGDLKTLLNAARETLRTVSWGSVEKWQKGKEYLYQNDYDTTKEKNRKEKLDRLKADLPLMAFYGSQIFDQLFQNQPDIDKLLPDTPAYIQVAIKDDKAKMMLPSALIYDYPFDKFHKGPIRFCPEFEEAFMNNMPLEETLCFKGHCPMLEEYNKLEHPKLADRRWMCPSGFWGFRHYLGMPLSAGKEEGDTIFPTIPVKDEMHVSVAFAQNLPGWKEHCKVLRDLFQRSYPRSEWNNALDREDLVDRVLKEDPHIVYFYCHGGEFSGGVAYLQIGPTDNPGNFRPGDPHDHILTPPPLLRMTSTYTFDQDLCRPGLSRCGKTRQNRD